MKHPFDVHVGSKLRQCRCVAGISRQQLGDKLGIKALKIQKLETGANHIDPNLMRKIVAALDVPASIFFEGLADALSDTA
jgi:transcriptional regulator with XRE-family HTH domain